MGKRKKIRKHLTLPPALLEAAKMRAKSLPEFDGDFSAYVRMLISRDLHPQGEVHAHTQKK